MAAAARALRVCAALAGLGLLLPVPQASAQDSGLTRADVTALGGHANVTEGFSDRTFATMFGNLYYGSGLGVHFEATGEWREEDAVYYALGLSRNTPALSFKGVLGSSSDNENILPEFYARGEVSYRTDPARGIVVTPALTWRQWRNTAEELSLEGNLTRYWALAGDRQMIGQVFGRVSLADPGSNLGASAGGDVTYGQYRQWYVGLTAEGGSSSYDSVLGAGGVETDFVSLRPHASIYVSDRVELIARAEYYRSDIYDLYGVSAGLKVEFDGS